MNPSDFKIAAIITTYFPASHADVIVSRWLEPHSTDKDWGWEPRTRIASMYVAQFPPDDALMHTPKSEWHKQDFSRQHDLARATSREYGVPILSTIHDALTMGGEALAVDGVLLIGEHGDYPFNELGQHLYPRKEFFDEIVQVFRQTGYSVPVFCDKHLSWNSDWALEMVETARRMGFPLMAGSSLPYSFNLPMPKGSQPVEGVALFDGGPEVYGFHSLEAMQALIEKRAGGEAGVRAITAYAQDGVWEAMEHGVWSHDLFDAALAACTLVKEGDVRANCQAISPWDQFGCPTAFHVEHADGVRNTHILLQGHIEDVAVAIRDRNGRTYANRWEFGDADVFYAHFARLNALIQEMFLTGRSPVPIERTLLTTLTIAACMQALQMPGIRIETPQLNLPYNTISCDTPRASISNSIS